MLSPRQVTQCEKTKPQNRRATCVSTQNKMADRATIGAPPTGLQGALQARYRNSAVARLLVEGRLPEGYSRDAGSPVQPPGQLDLEPPLDLSATGRQQRSSSPEEGQRSDPEPANPLLGNAGVHRRKRKHPAPHPDYPRTSPVKCTYCPFVARSSSMLYSHLQFHQQILSGPSSTSSSHMEWIKAYQKNDSDVTGSGPGPVLAHAPLTTPAEESASTLRNLLQSRENIVTTQNSASGFLKSIVQNILQNGKTPEQSGESRNGSPNPNPEDNAGERQSFQNTSAKHGSRLVERQSPWIPRHDNGIQNVLGSLYCRPSDLSPGLFLPDRKDHVAPGVDPASINPGSWPPADTYQSPGSELGGGGGGGGNRKWKRSRGDESRGVLSGGGGENQSSFNLSRVKEEPLTEPAEYGCYPAGVRPPSSGSSGGSHRDTPGAPPHTPPYAPDRPIAPDVLSSHVPAQPASLNIARVSPSSEYTRRDADAEDPVSAKRVAGSISRETSPKPDRSAQRELSPNRTKTVTQCVLQSVGQQCDVIAPRMGRTPTSPDSSSPTELCETGIQCQLLVPPREERLEDEGKEEEQEKEGEDPRDRRRLGVRGSGNEDHQDQTPWLGQGEEEATPLRPRPGSSGRPGVLAEEEGEGGGRASSLHCPHCGIHYDHEVIFSIHMGCHSHGDPFICNVCGRSCGDRFSFYTHIMRGHDAPGT